MLMADYIIISIMIISILIGIVRGMVKESITIVTWIAAAFLAILYTTPLSKYITITKHGFVHSLIAFLIIAVGVLFLGALLNYVVGEVVRKTPFSIPDRVLGSIFGLLRGVVLITILVLLGGLTTFPEESWWKESSSIARFQVLAMSLRDNLPEEKAKVFHFSSESEKAIGNSNRKVTEENIIIKELGDKKKIQSKEKT